MTEGWHISISATAACSLCWYCKVAWPKISPWLCTEQHIATFFCFWFEITTFFFYSVLHCTCMEVSLKKLTSCSQGPFSFFCWPSWHWCHSHGVYICSQLLPSTFTYCKQSKTRQWEGLGMRPSHICILVHSITKTSSKLLAYALYNNLINIGSNVANLHWFFGR